LKEAEPVLALETGEFLPYGHLFKLLGSSSLPELCFLYLVIT